MKVESDSMLIWYPKIKDLPIPKPKTEWLILNEAELKSLINENVPDFLVKRVKPLCDKMGYPCFLRTDLASAKHDWKKSCFVDRPDELWSGYCQIKKLLETSESVGRQDIKKVKE
jgi:hypothetical protein